VGLNDSRLLCREKFRVDVATSSMVSRKPWLSPPLRWIVIAAGARLPHLLLRPRASRGPRCAACGPWSIRQCLHLEFRPCAARAVV
jgi:hypothetical protein